MRNALDSIDRTREYLDPTKTLKQILNTLWNGPANNAPMLLRKLANEMETLHKANDGQQFSPDCIHAIEESDVYSSTYDASMLKFYRAKEERMTKLLSERMPT